MPRFELRTGDELPMVPATHPSGRVSVICINDGSIEVRSLEEATRDGWLVYEPTPQQAHEGIRTGMCRGCNEDAFASGAYL